MNPECYSLLFQYYSVLQSTSRCYSSATLCYPSTTLYQSSTTLMIDPPPTKFHVQCAHQILRLPRKLTLVLVLLRTGSWLLLFTHETLCTMRRATRVIVQPHQTLRLPPKRLSSLMLGTRLTKRGATSVSFQSHQILHLPKKKPSKMSDELGENS